ncbi:protein UL49 [Panine betaherpesvirus 2]|uniref:Protein UL49 n=1 Tax=Panine betaherpesvirus 2 TaxID=188763 RepID=Q8QS39_9BETA|nr:protein UL49 [Panine betaherpesvirus 2]AAM00699.1 protein UL49 [Panine betaherpesvirus 2]QXV67804.1 protein UL49 [Panine betaherpesvirus 2]
MSSLLSSWEAAAGDAFHEALLRLFGPLCVHDDHFHVQLVIGRGALQLDEVPVHPAQAPTQLAAQTPSVFQQQLQHQPQRACVLHLFVTDKRFLNRELGDRLYQRFLREWLLCRPAEREAVTSVFKRLVMTKPYFVFLAYVYSMNCFHAVSATVAFLRFERYDARYLYRRLRLYPADKLNALLDGVTASLLGDLHRFLFGADLRLPVLHPTSSPCLALLRAKRFEGRPDLPVYHRNEWTRDRQPRSPQLEALIAALRRHAGQVPCGNPLYVLARQAVQTFCDTCPRYLVPLRSLGLHDETRVGFSAGAGAGGQASGVAKQARQVEPTKIVLYGLGVALRGGLIGSVIDLPLWCLCRLKCERHLDGRSLVAVVCRQCGHCLNLGKEKLHCQQNFPLNSMFYYRDRQEKSVIFNTNAELVHCSLCGSQRVVKQRVYELVSETLCGLRCIRVGWKAVLGLNAACAVYDHRLTFDVILPCASRTCDSTVVVRAVTVPRLLRLTWHGHGLLCSRCQTGEYRDSCLESEDGAALCRGCALVKQTACHVGHHHHQHQRNPSGGGSAADVGYV